MQDQGECKRTESPSSHFDQPDTLYHRYAAAIFAYARLYMPSQEEAEDLTLDVFLTAVEHDQLSWLTEPQQFVWLRRVAHNKLIDRHRRNARCTIIPLAQVVATLAADETLTPEQQLLRQEALAQLYRAIGMLPPLQQYILQLRYGDDLSFAEIAVLLDKREEAARKLCSRTLARLRHIYSSYS